jgi:tetratricopeptide (TPR) repeat protein
VGWCYEKLDVSDSARIAYEKAISMDEKYAVAYLRLGYVYKNSGDLAKALQYAQTGFELEPDNLDYQYSVASILMLKGDAQAAYPHLKNVVAARPSHYWANYNLGQALIRLDRKTEGEHYLTVADSLFEILKVVDDWRNLARENPDQLGIWLNLGNALRIANEIDEAIEAYKMAIFLAPEHMTLYNDLANLFIMSGDTLKARMLYQTILEKNPGMSDVWLNLGVLYANTGREAQARHAWQKVLELAPGDETATKYLDQLNKL